MKEYEESQKVKSTLGRVLEPHHNEIDSSGALTADSYLSPVLKYRPAFRFIFLVYFLTRKDLLLKVLLGILILDTQIRKQLKKL